MSKSTPTRGHATLLIIRIITGIILMFAGFAKMSMMQASVSMFVSLGIPVFLAYLVTFGEVLGGFMILIGLWTKLVAPLLCIIMLGATYYSLVMGSGILALVPFVIFILLLVIWKKGSGKHRIHSSMFN